MTSYSDCITVGSTCDAVTGSHVSERRAQFRINGIYANACLGGGGEVNSRVDKEGKGTRKILPRLLRPPKVTHTQLVSRFTIKYALSRLKYAPVH